MKVAVIGGGMAGLGCLRALSGTAHVNATLFESTRVLGGRVRSMRRLGALSWDHGASHFSRPRDAGSPFYEVLRAAEKSGVVELWHRRDKNAAKRAGIGTAEVYLDCQSGRWVIDHDSFQTDVGGNSEDAASEHFVGVPDMAAVPSFIAREIVCAVQPEASWVGDNPEPGVPEYLTSCYVDRIRVLIGEETWVHAQSRRRWGMMLRIREGGDMWYKPFESDVVLLATNAPTAAAMLEAITVGECREGISAEKNRSASATQMTCDIGSANEARNEEEKKVNQAEVGIRARVSELAVATRSVSGDTCWALTVAFDRPLGLRYDAISLITNRHGRVRAGKANKSAEKSCPITFFANNSSKPGRPSGGQGAAVAGWGYRWAEVGRAPEVGVGECWVVRASPEWSNKRAGLTNDDAAVELCAEFLSLIGYKESARSTCSGREGNLDEVNVARVCYRKAFKWNHHLPLTRTGNFGGPTYRFHPEFGLGACGDWISGVGADVAYDGGVALGEAVLAHLAKRGDFRQGAEGKGGSGEAIHGAEWSDM